MLCGWKIDVCMVLGFDFFRSQNGPENGYQFLPSYILQLHTDIQDISQYYSNRKYLIVEHKTPTNRSNARTAYLSKCAPRRCCRISGNGGANPESTWGHNQ